MPIIKCVICSDQFKPVIRDQVCCSATCAKAGGFESELKRVRAELDGKVQKALREAGYGS